ncbi:MAG: DNA polymerase III subunit gamma/tau, partial [Candidatus Brocadiae bacterium]|nr:DNA polymerase III subunit gamma/tau [Candidatus Brocadiia bacterium]
ANAIKANRVAHAYLFCGSRGVGKTTVARILAKALNCKDGPTPEPCCQCDACRRIATGDDLDVMEIDGASNRGIDEVRELRQNVRLSPSHSRFKVYYIDEVHMLTEPAFNALLKTLEEPPAHVKFIFSTTDPQKLPETVKSRCQRFDFRRISDEGIVRMLGEVCGREGLQAEEGVAAVIARAARGSMRDALGTLDQLAAFGDELRMSDVLAVLGAVDRRVLAQIVDALAQEDAPPAANTCVTSSWPPIAAWTTRCWPARWQTQTCCGASRSCSCPSSSPT